MTESATMTIRLEPQLKSRLDKLSVATNRSKSFLAAEAVREYVQINEWQIKEIQTAVKEADANDFANEHDLQTVFNKWDVDAD